MLWLGVWAENLELRGITEGTSKSGNTFLTLKVEDREGNSNDVSVTGDNVAVARSMNLTRGDVLDLRLVIVTGRRSYAMLSREGGSLVRHGNAYTGLAENA